MADLNHQVLHDMETDLYFTMVLAIPTLKQDYCDLHKRGIPTLFCNHLTTRSFTLERGACLWVLLKISRLSVPNT